MAIREPRPDPQVQLVLGEVERDLGALVGGFEQQLPLH